MDREDLLNNIRKMLFYCVDLNLYTDSFQCCEKSTEDYEIMSSKLKKAIYEYEQQYGPLINFGLAYMQNPKAWIDTPWPWEKCKDGE